MIAELPHFFVCYIIHRQTNINNPLLRNKGHEKSGVPVPPCWKWETPPVRCVLCFGACPIILTVSCSYTDVVEKGFLTKM